MQGHVRIGDNTSIVEVVRTGDMGQETMQQDNISSLCNNGGELLAVFYMGAVRPVDRGIQTLRVIVKIVDNTCESEFSALASWIVV